MSIEEVPLFEFDNDEDYIYPIHLIECSEDQDLSFPEEYQKNVSDCQKTQSNLAIFNAYPTHETFEIAKSLQIPIQSQNLRAKEVLKIENQIFAQQSFPSAKTSEQTEKENTIEEFRAKKIIKKKYNKKILIALNCEERLKQPRQIKIQRYQQKKLKRNWNRGILYEERKKLAFRRSRIQGRFQGKFGDLQRMDEQKSWENSISK